MVRGPGVVPVLTLVREHLCIKREQARLALLAQSLNKRGRKNPNLQQLHELYADVAFMNSGRIVDRTVVIPSVNGQLIGNPKGDQ
jgi:lactam utilization protein B